MNETLTPAEVSALKQELLSSLHCALPGTVVSFDAAAQTASVQPALKRGSFAFPVLRDVPVFFPGSRESAVTWPVEAGDECLLVFADADIDRWFMGGAAGEPASGRRHDLSDAFAFVGFRSRPNALRDFPEEPAFFGTDPSGADAYTKAETDALLAGKSNTGHTHDSRYYTGSETDTKLSGKKNTQTAVADPSASGTAASFIASLSQNAQGVITAAKKTVRTMSGASSDAAGVTGLVPAPAAGAQGKYLRGNGAWATPAVSEGGTGMTGTGTVTSISSIAESAADCKISTAQYAYWGKVAMVRIVVTKGSAVSSGTTTVCTMVSGKRPRYNADAQWMWGSGARITTDGDVQVNGKITANETITVMATYILA